MSGNVILDIINNGFTITLLLVIAALLYLNLIKKSKRSGK